MNTSFIYKFYLDIKPKRDKLNEKNKPKNKLVKTNKEIDKFFDQFYHIFGF